MFRDFTKYVIIELFNVVEDEFIKILFVEFSLNYSIYSSIFCSSSISSLTAGLKSKSINNP